jgi:hypothetical protein
LGFGIYGLRFGDRGFRFAVLGLNFGDEGLGVDIVGFIVV